MQLDTFDKLLAHELKDLWSAGTQLKAFLPTLTDAAQDADLIAHLNGLREQTEEQVERIESIADDTDFGARGHKCRGMEGLVTEAKEILSEANNPEIGNAAIISALQRMLHYQIAAYGVARTLLEKGSRYEHADTIQTSLGEVTVTDQKLTRLAERKINFEALMSG
ncbi:MAG: DUF892 family protein [Longimicrobiales bacterium]